MMVIAINHLRGIRKFTPHYLLSPEEKAAIGPAAMTKAANPNTRLRNLVAAPDMDTK